MRYHQLPLFFIIAALALSPFVVCVFAYTAPFWLREGAYAYYHIESTVIVFDNGTSIWYANGTYGWKCVGVTGNNAILEMLFNLTGRKLNPNQTKTTPYTSVEIHTISINVETREASYGDEYLGFLQYWVPTDIENLPYMDEDQLPDWVPKNLQWRYIENFASYENVTTYGLVGGSPTHDVETSYKTYKGDQAFSIFGDFGETSGGFSMLYERDSGLALYEKAFRDNFLRKVIKTKGPIMNFLLEDTNIYSLPEPTSPLNMLLPYIITTTALTATATSIYLIKIRKKPQPKKTETSHMQRFKFY
jgi:hypothetical protein